MNCPSTSRSRYQRAVRADLPDAPMLALLDLARFPVLEQPLPAHFNLAVSILALAGAVLYSSFDQRADLPLS